MALNTVTNQFLAAMGLDRLFCKAIEDRLGQYYWQMMLEYRKEVQYERARLMRQNPMNYHAVRSLDRELDDINTTIREFELERMA